MLRKWSLDQLDEAVTASTSIAQVLRHLGLREAGGNYATINRLIKERNLDTSHWQGQGWAKGKTRTPSIPARSLREILVENSPHKQSHSLKRRLLKEGLLADQCSICKIESWLEKPLIMHLDHINGRRNDNRIENLRLLCPNCHSQTSTYCGKNIGRALY